LKRVLAILAVSAASLAAGVTPAAANGPGDPFSTNCEVIGNLAASHPVAALVALSGQSIGSPDTASATGDAKPPPKVASPIPVTMRTTADGGCDIQVNPHP
jgi:hypothetical protein